MQELNHTCVVCGKRYHACDTCLQEKSFVPWRTIADTINHFKIYHILNDYNYKIITKDQAKKQLQNVDLSDLDEYVNKQNVGLINEVLGRTTSIKKVETTKKDSDE